MKKCKRLTPRKSAVEASNSRKIVISSSGYYNNIKVYKEDVFRYLVCGVYSFNNHVLIIYSDL